MSLLTLKSGVILLINDGRRRFTASSYGNTIRRRTLVRRHKARRGRRRCRRTNGVGRIRACEHNENDNFSHFAQIQAKN